MSTNYFDQAATIWDDKPQRVRLMKAIGDAIVRHASPNKNMAVLDYGCGTGLVGLYLLPYVRSVTGADNSTGMLDALRKKIQAGSLEGMRAVRMDLERDPVPAKRYDLVVTGMAMHHIAGTQRVLRAFHEMLAPGGMLCIADLDTEPGTFHSGPSAASAHHHGFDRQEMKALLRQIGFIEPTDSTVITFSKPTEPGGEADFSVFLITAKRG